LLFSAAFIGLGSLFKEYAFLAISPIAVMLIYENRASFKKIIQKAFLPAVFATVPIILVYLFAYLKFHYTYLDWFGANKVTYVYPSRIIEYIKSFGSLLNLLGILFLCGLYVLSKDFEKIEKRIKVFLLGVFLSFLPVFSWPAITQRILFITVPFVIIISSFFIKKYENKYLWFFALLSVYILASFFMDSFILKVVDLPI
jgi:hypothetical protein